MAQPELRIGWVGLGKMGKPMAANLIRAGHPLTVYNRSPGAALDLGRMGARVATSPSEVAEHVDIVFSMISDDAAFDEITRGSEGLLNTLAPGAIHVDTSTVSPAVSAAVHDLAREKGVKYLSAPVSGSTALATAGTLTIIASGDPEAFVAARPLLERLGRVVHDVGTGEQARYLKLAINMMVGVSAAMMGEALVLAAGGSLDWRQSIDIINDSAVASPLLGYKRQMLAERDFSPAFTAEQMLKDFELIRGAASDRAIPMPLTALVRELLTSMVATGRGDLDFFACVTLLEDLAGRGRLQSREVRTDETP
jgi:3-hydroxyisobutyrate dehydrogenase-like beta-hydroxyacid dehydrogenase